MALKNTAFDDVFQSWFREITHFSRWIFYSDVLDNTFFTPRRRNQQLVLWPFQFLCAINFTFKSKVMPSKGKPPNFCIVLKFTGIVSMSCVYFTTEIDWVLWCIVYMRRCSKVGYLVKLPILYFVSIFNSFISLLVSLLLSSGWLLKTTRDISRFISSVCFKY